MATPYELVAPTVLDASRPAIELLPALAVAGITAVELWCGDERHMALDDRSQADALGREAARLGLRVHSLHAPFGAQADLGASEATARGRAVALHTAALRTAAALGASHIVAHPGHELEPGQDVAAALDAAARSVAELSEAATTLGVSVALENLPPGWPGQTADHLLGLIAGLDGAAVGFCLDTGHAYLAGLDMAQVARAFGTRLLGIHWHDNHGPGAAGADDQHLLPGLGEIAWEPLFGALREIGYGRPVTVEARVPTGMTLPEALLFVRRVLNAAQLPPPGLTGADSG